MAKISQYYRAVRGRGRGVYRPRPYGRPGFGRGRGIGSNQTTQFMRPYSMTTTQEKKSYSGGGVTSQYDKTVVYRKKRMPAYKRRRWVGFVKKVRAALMKDVGTKTVIRNTQLTSQFLYDGQGLLEVHLYGSDGSLGSSARAGADDLRQIFTNDPDLTNDTAKALFGSAICDLTFTNTSTSETGQNLGLEVDIYDIVYRKQLDAATFLAAITDAQTSTSSINSLNPQLDISFRGVTPWDFPDLLSKGVKILKKMKYFLGHNEAGTYQLRDSKNRAFRHDIVDNSDGNYVMPGSTRSLIVIVKGVPTGAPTEQFKKLQLGVTRKYMYKVVSKNTDQDNQIPA